MVSKCFRVVIYELLIDFPQSWFGRVRPLGNHEKAGGPLAASFSDKGAGQDGLHPCGPGPGGADEALAQEPRSSDV